MLLTLSSFVVEEPVSLVLLRGYRCLCRTVEVCGPVIIGMSLSSSSEDVPLELELKASPFLRCEEVEYLELVP